MFSKSFKHDFKKQILLVFTILNIIQKIRTTKHGALHTLGLNRFSMLENRVPVTCKLVQVTIEPAPRNPTLSPYNYCGQVITERHKSHFTHQKTTGFPH
jgi:hypothetical protein